MAVDVKFDKKKYEELYESVDDKNKIILYLLSKDKMRIEQLCQLKISDVSEHGIGNLELPRREQAALARYFKGSKAITSLEDPIFPSRDKNNRFLTPHKLKISLARIYKKAGVQPAEVGVNLSAPKEAINEENVDMGMVLGIIQEKLNKQQKTSNE